MSHDNSYGRGHYPLPVKLSGLGRYVEALKPSRLIDYKFFVDDNTYMLVADSGLGLSIMHLDMRSLLKHGLVRIQCNDPGTLSFYFKAKR